MPLASNCQTKINDLKPISVCNIYVNIDNSKLGQSLHVNDLRVHLLIRSTSQCTSCGNSYAADTKRKTWRLIDPLIFVLPGYRSSSLATGIHLVTLLPKLTKLHASQECDLVWLFFHPEKLTLKRLNDKVTSPAYGCIPWW